MILFANCCEFHNWYDKFHDNRYYKLHYTKPGLNYKPVYYKTPFYRPTLILIYHFKTISNTGYGRCNSNSKLTGASIEWVVESFWIMVLVCEFRMAELRNFCPGLLVCTPPPPLRVPFFRQNIVKYYEIPKIELSFITFSEHLGIRV